MWNEEILRNFLCSLSSKCGYFTPPGYQAQLSMRCPAETLVLQWTRDARNRNSTLENLTKTREIFQLKKVKQPIHKWNHSINSWRACEILQLCEAKIGIHCSTLFSAPFFIITFNGIPEFLQQNFNHLLNTLIETSCRLNIYAIWKNMLAKNC